MHFNHCIDIREEGGEEKLREVSRFIIEDVKDLAGGLQIENELGMPHTPEGQAKFFSKVIERLYKLPFMCGTIIYCYTDFDRCGYCGQSDCPTETLWGLVDRNGTPKPSYHAVKKAFEKCR